MRVALFGGSFDPPHRGHLAVARAAADQFRLDRVLLTPTGAQPLKPQGGHASFADRLQMTALLAAEDSRLEASTLEAPLSEGARTPNYTVDTLRRLRAELAPNDDLFAIAGADAFRALRQWRAPDELLRLAQWIVVSRPGEDLASAIAAVDPPAGARVHVILSVSEPVSATLLRARLAAHLPCEDLLTPPVLAFIKEHGLYGAAAGEMPQNTMAPDAALDSAHSGAQESTRAREQ